MTTCQARSTQDGMACAVCRIRWDRDDCCPCPMLVQDAPPTYLTVSTRHGIVIPVAELNSPPLVPKPTPFVSALAPLRPWER